MPFSVHYVWGEMMLLCLSTGDFNFDDLVQLVSAVFLHCKNYYFPFAVNKYPGGDTLRLCKYPFSLKFLPTNFGIHPDLVCFNGIFFVIQNV